jgi:predicted transcriptional regulator
MPETIADLMREWRRIAGLNTAEAGEELDLSSRSIEDIEQGRTRADDVLTRHGLEALIAQAKLHRLQDTGQRSAALAAVAERKKKFGRK